MHRCIKNIQSYFPLLFCLLFLTSPSIFGQIDNENYVFKKFEEAEELAKKNDTRALKNALEVYEQAKSEKNHNLIGKTENLIGNIYWYSSNYPVASDYYYRALKSFEKTKNKEKIAECYRNIGWIYLGQNNYGKAENYFKRSAKTYQGLHLERDYMLIMNDLGSLHLANNDFNQALYYCQLSTEIAEKLKEKTSIGTNYSTIGSIYLQLKNYDKAEEYFTKSISMLESSDVRDYNTAISQIGLANVYFEKEKYSIGLVHAKNAIQITEQGGYILELSEAYLINSKILSKLKQFDKAYEMSILYTKMKDSLHDSNNQDFLKQIENNYKIEEDRLKIQNLEQEGKLNNARLQREQSFKLFLIVILLLIFIFTVFLVRSIIRKKKANHSLTLAYSIIEEKNKDISDSIDYAQHIQQARLPLIENLKKEFNEIFVYYCPRDIVSGDFYWFDARPDGSAYFVCADCTGHGIPGAFMSMIGIDGFNYAILEKNILHTGEILTHVNRFIIESLNQEHESTKSTDGMDAAIIALNPERDTISFSGANRPIFLIRNNELMEFKPNKMSIGGNRLNKFHFEQQSIPVQQNDCIYLFTDGFADQFGGAKNKKFMIKKLKDLLLTIHQFPMQQQNEKITKAFNDWKGNQAQVDDVLVVGIRI